MQTPEQHAEYQAAYEAWTEVWQRRKAVRLAIFRGEQIPDQQHLLTQADELMRAHKRCVEAAGPFSGWGNSL